MEFAEEFGVILVMRIRRFQFFQRVGQCLGNEAAAIRAEMAGGIGKIVGAHVRGIVVHDVYPQKFLLAVAATTG